MNRAKPWWPVATIAISLNSCISQAAHQALQVELDKTKVEEARLSNQNQILTAELVSRSRELEALRQRLQALETQTADVELLTQRNLELSNELARLHDSLVDALAGEIRASDVKVALTTGRLWIRLAEKVLFDSGSPDLKPQGQEVLDRVGSILKAVKDMKIEVQGHTDDVPIGSRLASRFPTNWELSSARASSVVRYFVARSGIPPAMLLATGFADTRPVADNTTPEGRAANRRIEIVLSPQDVEATGSKVSP